MSQTTARCTQKKSELNFICCTVCFFFHILSLQALINHIPSILTQRRLLQMDKKQQRWKTRKEYLSRQRVRNFLVSSLNANKSQLQPCPGDVKNKKRCGDATTTTTREVVEEDEKRMNKTIANFAHFSTCWKAITASFLTLFAWWREIHVLNKNS